MKQVKNSFNLLSNLSDSFLPLVIILMAIPLFAIFALGIYFLFSEGYTLYFILFLAIASFLVFILHLLSKQQAFEKQKLSGDEIIIETSPAWAEFDDEVYKKLKILIDKNLEKGIEWGKIQTYSLEVISETAFYYNPENSEKELAFSASELLLALEKVSCRYRALIKEYVPFENKINLSIIKQGHNHQDKMAIIKHLYNAYRASRMVNPVGGLISELRGKITSHLFEGVSSSLQNKIKRALLREVASVSIDLYRGYFKMKDSELSGSKISDGDKTNLATAIEPLRVVVVGQVSAGKSSVINALIERMVAEVSVIPSTDKIEVHECKIDGIEAIKLIDLPGLDGNVKTEKIILEQMIHSDIIFWILKANQSARKLDSLLKSKFDEFYQKTENRSRKRPDILALVNQVDKLEPEKEWNPPYDLKECDVSNKKACTIRDAIKYNQDLLDPDDILALSVKSDIKMYNVDAMKKYLQKAYDNGINTQLNRRRLEYSGDNWIDDTYKFFKAGKKLYDLE